MRQEIRWGCNIERKTGRHIRSISDFLEQGIVTTCYEDRIEDERICPIDPLYAQIIMTNNDAKYSQYKSCKLILPEPSEPIVERLTVDTSEAAKMIGVSPKTIFNLTRSGKLQCKRIGRRVLYAIDELRRFVDVEQKSPGKLFGQRGRLRSLLGYVNGRSAQRQATERCPL